MASPASSKKASRSWKKTSMTPRWTPALIAAGQRAEHYEMAAYGTLVAWAQAMGHTEAAKLLQQTLDEEKAADKKLSGLAEGEINQSAADAVHSEEDEEPEAVTAGGARKSASKSGRR
jgi:ferritin-like metal-binding protein YciE